MRRMLSCAWAVALVACASVDSPTPDSTDSRLVVIRVTDSPAENGKTLSAYFRETDRKPDYSRVEVVQASGGSVSSSLFTLRGVCAVLKARGERFVASTAQNKIPPTYLLTFPKDPAPDQLRGASKNVFSAADCARLGF